MFKFLRSFRLSVTLLAVVALLIFLHYSSILKPVENLLIRIFSPLQMLVYSVGVKFNGFYTDLPEGQNLIEANRQLKDEVDRLIAENARLRILAEENKAISSLTDFLAQANMRGVTARVIGKNPEAKFQALILDKGSKDGIKVDMPLVIADGILVGKIIKVRSNSAEAILVNDPRSRLAAMVENETESKGVLIGEYGLSLRMELIPQNETVKENDVVVTSGLEPTIPRGLVVGKVTRVLTEPNNFFQTAWIRPLVKIDNLTVVLVLTSSVHD